MKRNYWPLFFIGIFSFTLAMIVWTIMSATKVPVNEDNSFLESYKYVDDNYNNILTSNVKFLSKYEFNLLVNDKKVPLSTDDIKFSQRVLEKKSTHKDLLKKGNNTLSVYVINKESNKTELVTIELKVTKSVTNHGDIDLSNKDFKNIDNKYFSTFEIKEENNWNITGKFTIDGNLGYIFIKTNAI